MPKIDAHQHYWNPARLHYGWMNPTDPVLYRPYLPADLAPHLAANDVGITVVVQATHDEAETRWLLELADNTPTIGGVVGWLDLTAPDFFNILAAYSSGKLCGVRHQTHDEPDPRWLLRPDVLRGLRMLADAGVPFDLLVRPEHLPHLPELFEAVPNGRWIVDHIAKPHIATGMIEQWRNDMRRIAQYANVACKLSGMITEADHTNWTRADIQLYFDVALEAFTPARLMFGSDWPVCLLAGSYAQVIGLATDLIAELSPTEQAAIWGDTARAWYGL